MTQDSTVFADRTVYWLIVVGVLSFVGALLFSLFGQVNDPEKLSGTNTFSRSAIGHRAFVEFVLETGVPVVISQNNSLKKIGPSNVLALIEPRDDPSYRSSLRDALNARRVLLVLPKWEGRQSRTRRHWVDRVELLPASVADDILRTAVPGAKVIRGTRPIRWTTGQIGVAPTLARPQLMRSPQISPIVSSDEGILVGEVVRSGRRITIVSDPDVLSNHGLDNGDNAILMSRLVDSVIVGRGSLIVDETLHGFRIVPNPWQLPFRMPFVITTVIVLFALGILVWAAVGRFGAPIPMAPPLGAGKVGLIDNTANLIQVGGHGPEIMRRYLNTSLRTVARRVHAPPDLTEAELLNWLSRRGAGRGVSIDYGQIRKELEDSIEDGHFDEHAAAKATQDAHQWEQEMIDGRRPSSSDQRTT
ncbi:MAG: hypothetical protein IH905_17400 [Proteobacteria bacterium]|nr:hypothetical protein [Pseudomonadota bacterium]